MNFLRVHFFRLDLLGGEPAWQLLHGWPFAIAGVACAFDVANVSVARVRKTSAVALKSPLKIANLTAFEYFIFALRFIDQTYEDVPIE